jgi:hypothetical protein
VVLQLHEPNEYLVAEGPGNTRLWHIAKMYEEESQSLHGTDGGVVVDFTVTSKSGMN